MIPQLKIISDAEVEMIHETSLKILEEVGMVFSYEPAKEVFKKHGAKIEGDRVYLPHTMVEEKIKTAPSSFKIYTRNADRTLEVNTTNTFYGGPGGAAYVQDLDNGRRYGTNQDHINLAKIMQMLPHVDFLSQISCEVNDVDVRIRSNMMTFNNLKYTDKPCLGGSLGYETAKQSIELAGLANDGIDALKEKPVILSIPCSLTPLGFDDNMTGAIMAYAEYNQVQLINSLPIAGATGPATFAGSAALQNAEILAGIVLAQCVNPGCPVVYSASTTGGDMGTGSLAIGSPEHAIFSLLISQMAKRYNIPCRNSGFLSDSKAVDFQAGYEAAITGIIAELSYGNIIAHCGGIFDSYNCVSYEKLILDEEIIGYAKHIAKGVAVNEDTLAFDVIKEIGPQGEFLSSPHTFEHFRDTLYRPFIGNRQNVELWKAEGCQTIEERANAKWKQLLEEYVEPALPADAERDMKKYLEIH